MILYFSGTGNSYYVAKKISMVINDEIVSINQYLKEGKQKLFESDKPFIIVSPTHSWRIPRIVDSFISESTFKGSNKIYFVLTCGGEAGNAVEYAKKSISKKGLTFMGLTSIVMPDNYVALYDSSDRIHGKVIVKNAIPQIIDIAKVIKNGEKFPDKAVTALGKFNSSVTNPLFYKIIVSSKGFHTNKACIGCKKCVTLCPLNNIEMDNNRPRWGSNCIHCMACIGGCPKEAIEYKNRTKGKPRYYNREEPTV